MILDNAFNAATRDGPFKPQIFARQLESLRRTTEVVFSPEESAQLAGFVRLSQAAQRAGRGSDQFNTGLATGGLGAAAVFDPATASVGAGTIASLSLLLTTKAGRGLLTRANSGINRGLLDRSFKLSAAIGETLEKAAQRSASEQAERIIE